MTGAAGGLGQELCRNLAARGVRVFATDVGDVPANESGPGEIIARSLDVTDPAACRRLASELEPDIWVNNAGLLGAGEVTDLNGESAASVIAVNVNGVVNGTLAAIGVMRAKNSGRILNVGSFASWLPAPGLALYAGTKHAVRAFSVASAAELAGSGIRISVLCPDGIWTPMLHQAARDGTATIVFSARRLLDPAVVAAAGVRLIETGALVGSIPRSRAVLARLAGSSGSVVVKAYPFLRRAGRPGQKRMRDLLEGTGQPV